MVDLWCYPTRGKKKALRICEDFANGVKARGDVAEVAPIGQTYLEDGAAFFYGWTSHTIPLIRECQAKGIDWYYADNAYYFGRGKFFRITKNAFMHDGAGDASGLRFGRFPICIKRWQNDGAHILITTQSELFYHERLGTTRAAWTSAVINDLRRYTDRKIVICDKPPDRERKKRQPHAQDFEDHLTDAWAMVTYSSSTAVKAIIEGIPVFSLATSMASVMGIDDLARIEEPVYPDGRIQWLWNLAANQWTFKEIERGRCWRDLESLV